MRKNDLARAEELKFRGKLGAVFFGNRTVFRVWSPFADSVCLRLYDAENRHSEPIKMTKRNGVFECSKTGLPDGISYTFLVTKNGRSVETADPYSVRVTADGKRSVLADMRKNKPDGWDVQPKISGKDPIIYELSVRDFSMSGDADFKFRGKFSAFSERGVKNSHGDAVGLEYIKSLGVTHIQLMPVFDFDFMQTEYNWGYNPRFHNAPSGYYSREDPIRELRELIMSAHQMGLGVIADVVYNHLFSAEKCALGKVFPKYYFRGRSNGSGCGNEFASERFMARKYIIDSLEFLAREYKFDGFRFDLMGLLDLKTMREISRRLTRTDPDILLYGEGWTGGESALDGRLRAEKYNAGKLPAVAFFNDDFRDSVKGSVFNEKDCGFVNGSPNERNIAVISGALTGKLPKKFRTLSPTQSINYVECHDNHTLFDKLRISLENADTERILLAEKMSAAIIFLSVGIPFFQAGEEFLRSKNFNSNSYSAGDEINSLKWDKVSENRGIVSYYRGLTAFRKRFLKENGTRAIRRVSGGLLLRIEVPDGEFYFLANPTDEKITLDISGKFEIFADENSASDSAFSTEEKLSAEKFSIKLARRTANGQTD